MFYLILGSGCKSVARQFLTMLGIQQKVFMTLLSTPSASPPKAPRSSFKSFEAITDPLCMIPFFKQWLSVCTLCFWNPNWSHKHNRLATACEFCLWFVDLKNASLENIVAQSICTPLFYFIRSAWYFFRVWNLKKIWVVKCKVQKNKVIVSQKEKRQPGLFSFWITMTLFFHLAFIRSIFWTWFFSGSQTDPCFQNKNSGYRFTGQIYSSLDGHRY